MDIFQLVTEARKNAGIDVKSDPNKDKDSPDYGGDDSPSVDDEDTDTQDDNTDTDDNGNDDAGEDSGSIEAGDDPNESNNDDSGTTDYGADSPSTDSGDDNTDDSGGDTGDTNDYGADAPSTDDGGGDDTGGTDSPDAGGDDTGGGVSVGDDPNSSDTGDSGGTDSTTDYGDGAPDSTGSNDDSGGDTGSDDTGGDAGGTDDSSGGDEGGDDSSSFGGDDSSGDSGDDTSSTDSDSGDDGLGGDSEEVKKAQNNAKVILLLRNFIRMHKEIEVFIKRVSESRRETMLSIVTAGQVTENLRKLQDVVYKYIILSFDHYSYEVNLYNFNYFLELMRWNLEMIRKVQEFNETDDEKKERVTKEKEKKKASEASKSKSSSSSKKKSKTDMEKEIDKEINERLKDSEIKSSTSATPEKTTKTKVKEGFTRYLHSKPLAQLFVIDGVVMEHYAETYGAHKLPYECEIKYCFHTLQGPTKTGLPNLILHADGMNWRVRSEILLIKNNMLLLAPHPHKINQYGRTYKVPGGGIDDPEETIEHACARECAEEALIIPKNVNFTGEILKLPYGNKIPEWHKVTLWLDDIHYDGAISFICIGEYAKKNTGYVKKVDQDPAFKNAQFYTWEQCKDFLSPEHKKIFRKYLENNGYTF